MKRRTPERALPGPGVRQPVLLTAICLCSLLFPTACGTRADDSSVAPDHVSAVVIPVLITAPFHIAQAEGYFADENLDVEFVRLTRNIDAIPALAQGQVDVGIGQYAVSMLNAVGGGARIRAVAGDGRLAPGECTFHGVIIQSDLFPDGPRTDPGEFRGRRAELDIALPHAYWLDTALQPAGLSIDDLEIVNVPMPATADAFRNDAFDITGIDEPRLSPLIASGDATLWRGTEQIVPDYQISMVFFGRALLDERPEVGERFVAAFLRGVRQYAEGKTDRNLDILEEALRLTRDELRTMCWAHMDADGRMLTDGILGYQEWALTRGLVDRVLSDDELVDRRFIEAAATR